MELKTRSVYARNYLHIFGWTLFAILVGPVAVFRIISLAIEHNVSDTTSWIVIGLASLFFLYISYSKFRYIAFVIFGRYEIKINEAAKTIEIHPTKESVDLNSATEFVYVEKYKMYVFRFLHIRPSVSIEIARNTDLENAVEELVHLKCKVE